MKEFIGEIIALSNTKTATVAIEHLLRHPLYKKQVRITRRFLAHIEGLDLQIGDKVRLKETRPISRRKHFLIIEKIKI